MKILVQKFGGTSVADLECQKKVLAKVKRGLDNGYKVVAVLSARHGDTNNLLALAREWSAQPDPAECDSLVSTGEQVSISLFTMLLKDNGIKARSLLAWQIPLITDDSFGSARIESIDGEAIRKLFNDYDVLVIAGFLMRKNGNSFVSLAKTFKDGIPWETMMILAFAVVATSALTNAGSRHSRCARFLRMRNLYGCRRCLHHGSQCLQKRQKD